MVASYSLDRDDAFNLRYPTYVVRTRHATILVDSCLGNARGGPAGAHMKTDQELLLEVESPLRQELMLGMLARGIPMRQLARYPLRKPS